MEPTNSEREQTGNKNEKEATANEPEKKMIDYTELPQPTADQKDLEETVSDTGLTETDETEPTEETLPPETEAALEAVLNVAEIANKLRLEDIESRYGSTLLGRFRAFLAGEFDFDILPEGETRRNALKTLARKAFVSIFNRRTLLGGAALAGVGIFTGGVGAVALGSLVGGTLGNTLVEFAQLVAPKNTPETARRDLLELYIRSSQALVQEIKEQRPERPEDVSALLTKALNTIQSENSEHIKRHHQEILDLERRWNMIKSAFYGLGALAGGALVSLASTIEQTQNLASNFQDLGPQDYNGDGIYHRVIKIQNQLYYQVTSKDLQLAAETGWQFHPFQIEGVEGLWHGVFPNQSPPVVQSDFNIFNQISQQASKLWELAPAAGALCAIFEALHQPQVKPKEKSKDKSGTQPPTSAQKYALSIGRQRYEDEDKKEEHELKVEPVEAVEVEYLPEWEEGETYAFLAREELDNPLVCFVTIKKIVSDNNRLWFEGLFYKLENNGKLKGEKVLNIDGRKMANTARIKIDPQATQDLESLRQKLHELAGLSVESDKSEAEEEKEEEERFGPEEPEEEERFGPEEPEEEKEEERFEPKEPEEEKEEEKKTPEKTPTPTINRTVEAEPILFNNIGVRIGRGKLEQIEPGTRILIERKKGVYANKELEPQDRIRFTAANGKSVQLVYEGKDYKGNLIFSCLSEEK